MNKVKVDLQCPFCGYCKVLKIPSHRKGITCPSCQQSVFLSWSTGVEGYVDEHGFYFHAYEPFNIHKINQEFNDAFASKSKTQKPSFAIRQKQK